MRALIPLSFIAGIASIALGCGGATTGPASTARDARQGEESPGGASAGSQASMCDDGTCFRCGDGICPVGFYCESSGSSTGCAWSKECAKKATCECLAAELREDPDCTCEERDGFPFVTCAQ